MITCFGNDYGYEKWVEKSLEFYADVGDTLILISCSGNSKNLVNAAKYALKKKINLVTMTGCKKNNGLNRINSKLRLWINSNSYNHIEILHHYVLLSITDKIILKKKKL